MVFFLPNDNLGLISVMQVTQVNPDNVICQADMHYWGSKFFQWKVRGFGLISSFEELVMSFFPCNSHRSILCGPKVFSSQIVEALKSIAHKFEMSWEMEVFQRDHNELDILEISNFFLSPFYRSSTVFQSRFHKWPELSKDKIK